MDHLTITSTTLDQLKPDNDFNDDNEDALSFRDLQMYNQTDTSSTRSSPRTSLGQELFEFFPTLSNTTATKDIMFCGKLIPGSSSFRLPEREIDHMVPRRSISHRDLGSPRHSIKLSSSVKKVNITTLTSMSSKSRKRMFMFGPVKFMPEMEMSSIRERQGRRIPSSRMFPVVVEDGDALVTRKNQTLTCRARLNSVFERSLACLRP